MLPQIETTETSRQVTKFLLEVQHCKSSQVVGKRKLARKFNLSCCYIDDLIFFNNKRFQEFISDIYPKELTIFETTESTSVASYLDLLFIRDKSNNITTKIYDKRAQGVYSDMYMTGGLAQAFYGIPQKINTRKNQAQRNKFMKITDPKK